MTTGACSLRHAVLILCSTVNNATMHVKWRRNNEAQLALLASIEVYIMMKSVLILYTCSIAPH